MGGTGISVGPAGAAASIAEDAVFCFRRDGLVNEVVSQLLNYFIKPEEKQRIEALLSLKVRELVTLLLSAPVTRGFDGVLNNLHVMPRVLKAPLILFILLGNSTR
jgi:hypothetical protein